MSQFVKNETYPLTFVRNEYILQTARIFIEEDNCEEALGSLVAMLDLNQIPIHNVVIEITHIQSFAKLLDEMKRPVREFGVKKDGSALDWILCEMHPRASVTVLVTLASDSMDLAPYFKEDVEWLSKQVENNKHKFCLEEEEEEKDEEMNVQVPPDNREITEPRANVVVHPSACAYRVWEKKRATIQVSNGKEAFKAMVDLFTFKWAPIHSLVLQVEDTEAFLELCSFLAKFAGKYEDADRFVDNFANWFFRQMYEGTVFNIVYEEGSEDPQGHPTCRRAHGCLEATRRACGAGIKVDTSVFGYECTDLGGQ